MAGDDDDDDLFADSDSDDTAELIASSKKNSAKKEPPKKKAAAPAKNDSDDEGLFDSDNDSDDDDNEKKKKDKKEEAPPKKKELSKRERLEALAKKKKEETKVPSEKKPKKKKEPSAGAAAASGAKDQSGYDSEDTYDSGTFERTKEDDDFIDTTGEDAEDIRELYAEQNFDDERPDDDMGGGKKKGKKRRYRADEAEEVRDGEPDNPIMAAVYRMKKKKREKKTFSEQEEEIKTFLGKMELAAEEDEQAIAERRPGMKKLAMLNEVVDMLARRDMQRMLLDFDLLTVCKRWIQPLPNGGLGNVTIRQRLLEVISTMNGENGITANDLKRSELGKVVMILYKHHSETPAMKQKHKALIEQWSRPIFQKSGNMRDLERVHAHRGGSGLSAVARRQQFAERASAGSKNASGEQQQQDLNSLIASGKKGNTESGINRVRVPFSKGFAFSVRPTSRADTATDKRGGGGAAAKDNRGKLSKRMVEKGRAVSKNQRSANISIEGRQTKG